MKKNITLIGIFFMLISTSGAQIYFEEDFSTGVFPPENWEVTNHQSNWSLSETAEAGGEAPEVKFTYQPQFDDKTRLITPPLDLSEINSPFLVFSFLHNIDRYSGFFETGLSYRSQGGAWKNIWEKNIYADIPAEEKIFLLKDDFPLNSNNIQFSFYFDGNSSNINDWYIDEVKLFYPEQYDASLLDIVIPGILHEPSTIAGTIENKGSVPLYSFDLNWMINGGEMITESFYGSEAGYAENINFETSQTLIPEPGENHIHFFISNVNGMGADSNQQNDTIIKKITKPLFVSGKKPLFESFTSSTCPPCASFNLGFFNNFLQNNKDDLSVIKYQMNWPGSGDPYFNPDGNTRRNYYGVSSVPDLKINGNTVSLSSSAVNNAFNNSLQQQALVDITGAFYTDGNDIHLQGSLLPYADHENLTLQIAIAENSTTGNASTNGETIFYSVMMKMLPDASGTSVNLTSGESFDFSHSFDMSSTHVEEMTDLKVIVFLQDNNTKDIVQSAYLSGSTEGKPTAATYPENEDTGASVWEGITITFDQQIQLPGKHRIQDEDIQTLVSFHQTDNPENTVSFQASVNSYGNQFTIKPVAYLDAETQYTIAVDPVQGYWGTQSDPFSFTFTTRAPLEAPQVTFDPENGAENIDLHHSTIHVYFDQQVRKTNGEFFQDEDTGGIVQLFAENTDGEQIPVSGSFEKEFTQIKIVPEESLLPGQNYVLQIASVSGEDDVLSNPAETSFTTRASMGAPMVLFNPGNNALHLEADARLMVIFSQPVRLADGNNISPENAHQHFTLLHEGNEVDNMELEIQINNTENIFILHAPDGFELNTTYQLTISPLMGMEGDLTDEIIYQFSTRESFGPPEAVFDPSPQSFSVPVDKTLVITFNQPVRMEDGAEIDQENIFQSVMLHKGSNNEGEAVEADATINDQKTEIAILPVENLDHNQQYSIYVNSLLGVDHEVSDPVSARFTTEISFSTDFPEFSDLKIYPNPANGILHIEGLPQNGKDLTVRLLTIESKMIISRRIDASLVEIPVNHLKPGVYFLEIINNEKVFREKIAIMR